MKLSTAHFALLLLCGAFTSACTSALDDPDGTSVSHGAARMLDQGFELPLETWQEAPAGCESLLHQHLSFAVAEGAPELLAAVDENGSPVCVDTLDAIEAELDLLDTIDSTTAARLRVRFLLALETAEVASAPAGMMPRKDDGTESGSDSSSGVTAPAHALGPIPQPSNAAGPIPQPSISFGPIPQPSNED